MTTLALAAAVVVVSAGEPAYADEPFQENILVTGTGQVSGAPDTLTADFGVETDAVTISQAMDSANTAAAKVRDALVHAGIAKADLQTSNFSVGTKVNDKQVVIGYTVDQGLTAKIRNLRKAGDIMSAAIAAGGDASRLSGVSFSIDNDAALLAQARRKAFADAKQKAELYAQQAGRPLGRVLQVSETTTRFGGGPIALHSAVAFDSRVTIEPGSQQLSANVTVEWAFDSLPKPSM